MIKLSFLFFNERMTQPLLENNVVGPTIPSPLTCLFIDIEQKEDWFLKRPGKGPEFHWTSRLGTLVMFDKCCLSCQIMPSRYHKLSVPLTPPPHPTIQNLQGPCYRSNPKLLKLKEKLIERLRAMEPIGLNDKKSQRV